MQSDAVFVGLATDSSPPPLSSRHRMHKLKPNALRKIYIYIYIFKIFYKQADERRYREICAMDDDQEEMLEPLGLGLLCDPSASGSSATAVAAAGGGGGGGSGGAGGGGDPMSGGSGSRPKIKYAIEV